MRGQKLFEVVDRKHELNDDRILDCCLFFARHTRVVLISNDRNLCVKALVHNVFCFTWDDLPKDQTLLTMLYSRAKPEPSMEIPVEPPSPPPARSQPYRHHPRAISPNPSPRIERKQFKEPRAPKHGTTDDTPPTSPTDTSKKRERPPSVMMEDASAADEDDARGKKTRTQSPKKKAPSPSLPSQPPSYMTTPPSSAQLSSTQLTKAIADFKASWTDITEVRLHVFTFFEQRSNDGIITSPGTWFPP